MFIAARTLLALAAISFAPGCAQNSGTTKPARGAKSGPLAPSPRLIVGRILAVDSVRGYAFVDLVSDHPPAAIVDGAELLVRTLDFKETAQLRVSRYTRGRTLGAIIVAGKPSTGDEVVWLAP